MSKISKPKVRIERKTAINEVALEEVSNDALKVGSYKRKIVAVPNLPETKVMYILGKRILGSVERLENKIFELSFPPVIEYLKKAHMFLEGTEESFNQLLEDATAKAAVQKEED